MASLMKRPKGCNSVYSHVQPGHCQSGTGKTMVDCCILRRSAQTGVSKNQIDEETRRVASFCRIEAGAECTCCVNM